MRGMRGHTLIELMVAIIIGLIMVLASFQVLAMFEGHKRTTTGMNDALQSGNFGIYTLDKLIRSSGSGLVQSASFAYGCPLNYTPTGGTTVSSGVLSGLPAPFSTNVGSQALRVAPVVIFPNTTDPTLGPDVFLLMSGGAGFGEMPVPVTRKPIGTELLVATTVGLSADEWVLLGGGGAANCMLTTVSSVPDNKVLTLAQATVGAASLASYSSGYVVGLGNAQAASFVMYGVDSDDTLYSVDLLNSNFAKEQASDDVVMMRAVYGIDADSDGKLDAWVNPVDSGTGASALSYSPASLLNGSAAANKRLRSIKAIRVALIVRAPLMERADASTPAFNDGSYKLFEPLDNAHGVHVTWNVPAGQENYRFRVLEGTIPVRNAVF